jgi:hypothetical protein
MTMSDKTDPMLDVLAKYAFDVEVQSAEGVRTIEVVALSAVRALLRSDETAKRVIAAIPHADWCCTKGCVHDGARHMDVEVDGGQPILVGEFPCPGDCTCEVGVIVRQTLAVLAGDDR